MVSKRFLSLLAMCVVLGAVTLVTSVSAAPNAPFTTQIVRATVNWSIPADQCSQLPAGLALNGTGKRYQVLSTKTKSNGDAVTMSNDFVQGTATDGDQLTVTLPPASWSMLRLVPSTGPATPPAPTA